MQNRNKVWWRWTEYIHLYNHYLSHSSLMTCSRWECMSTFPSDCVHGDQGRRETCAPLNHTLSFPSALYSSYTSLFLSFNSCIFRLLFCWLVCGRLSWWEFEPNGCIRPRSDSQEELGAASTHANATSAPDTPPTSTLQSSQSTAWDQLKWHQSEKVRDRERDCKSAYNSMTVGSITSDWSVSGRWATQPSTSSSQIKFKEFRAGEIDW